MPLMIIFCAREIKNFMINLVYKYKIILLAIATTKIHIDSIEDNFSLGLFNKVHI